MKSGKTQGTALNFHPLADRLPDMSEQEFAGLLDDIQANGQRDPIILLDKKILDGRHRYKACQKLGLPPKFADFKKSWGAPVDFVISKAMHRNMTTGQKAVAAEALMDDLIAIKQRGDGRASEIAALRFGVAKGAIEQVRAIRHTAPDIYQELRAGRLNVHQAFLRTKHAKRVQTVRELRESQAISPDALQLLLGDNIEQMETLPRMSVRVIFADPPYNCGWKYRSDPTGDRLSDEKYLVHCGKWLHAAKRLLTLDGSIFVVIDDNYADRISVIMRSIGLHHRRTIIWWETFGNYASAESNLSPACRFILYFSKSEDPLFNNIELRDESVREQMKDARSTGLGKVPDSVWPASRIQGNNAERVPWQDKKSPPQLPIAIPLRCIQLASQSGDTVLDPFNGNGTTGIAALRAGRNYIGIDRDPLYIERSRKWIAHCLAEGRGNGRRK